MTPASGTGERAAVNGRLDDERGSPNTWRGDRRSGRRDLRLLAPVLAAWGAAGAVLLDPARRWLVVLALVGGLIGALAARASRPRDPRPARRALVRAAAVACAAGAAVSAVAAINVSGARVGPLARAAAQRSYVVLDVVLTDDPHLASTSSAKGAVRRFDVVRASARSMTAGGRRWVIRQPVLLITPATSAWSSLLPSQRARVAGVAEPPRGHDVLAAVVAVRGPPLLRGRPSAIQRLAGTVRAGLRRATSGIRQPVGGLVPGLVDGDTSRLDPQLEADFRTAGMTHLVAVSGANMAIVVSAAVALARRMRVSLRGAAIMGALALLGFVVVARPSASVVRAGAMSAVLLLGLLTGRRGSPLPALLGSVLVLLLASPALALQPGFALSVAATAGIVVLGPPISRRLRGARLFPARLADIAAVAAAAQLACLPVLVAMWGQLAVTAIPANMLAEPAVPPATVLGVLAAVVAPICLPVARLLADLAAIPAQWLVLVATRAAELPSATAAVRPGVTSAVAVTAVVAIALLALRRPAARRGLAAAVVGSSAALLGAHVAVPGWPPPGWVLVACDVGQGDGLALRVGERAAAVIDTGPEPIAMARCLRRLGVRDVPVVVLSHFHADHVEGLPGVLASYHPAALLVGPLDEPPNEAGRVQSWARAAGVPMRVLRLGERLTVGTATLDVVAPIAVLHGTDSDPNNDSVVLRVSDGGIRLLLTGDVQAQAQQALLRSGEPLTADVLKVPHHGSADQDDGFLAAVHARAALVSVGAGNTYGQPAPRTLRALARDGVPAYRTDLDGDIAVVVRSGRVSVVPTRSGPTPAQPARKSAGKRASALSSGGPPRPAVREPARHASTVSRSAEPVSASQLPQSAARDVDSHRASRGGRGPPGAVRRGTG